MSIRKFNYRPPALPNLRGFPQNVFVDPPADIRVIRRIKRDINKRGRDLTSIIKQYFSTVRNMHFKFVEPTKKFADIILNEGGKNPVAIKTIENTINTMLMEIDG